MEERATALGVDKLDLELGAALEEEFRVPVYRVCSPLHIGRIRRKQGIDTFEVAGGTINNCTRVPSEFGQ